MKLAVLVAEGDVSLRAMICDALHAAGHSAVAVEDHQAALARLADSPFDVLVSDLGLPDGTGFELMQQFRERYPIRGIAMSGFSGPGTGMARPIGALT